MTGQFPADGMELTHILVVTDIERARTFYRDAPGAEEMATSSRSARPRVGTRRAGGPAAAS
jgi:hypothetical protein